MHKITATDPESHSADLLAANIAKLKELFPEVVAEGKVDFKALQEILGNEVETGEEFYRFTWAGKAQARREAHKPSTGTLRPCPAESVDWDNTKNLYIEGDNLEVLKLLQKSYGGKVKMIYIDPPYNTGKDFVYKDNYHDNLRNYKELTGQVDSEGNTLSTNSDTDGRYHSNWLNMMYPRLRLAKNLLREDGVIFISIDDNEIDNLNKLCREVLGENNQLATFIWKSKSGGANDSGEVAVDHEYIVCLSKRLTDNALGLDPESVATTSYNKEDEHGRFALERLDKQNLQYSSSMDYDLMGPDGTVYKLEHRDPARPNAIWRWSREKVEQNMSSLVFKDGHVYTKNYEKKGGKPRSLLVDERFGRTRTGSTEVRTILEGDYFDNPKPTKLVKAIVSIGSTMHSVVVDFFSGSGSTAHAVMQLNAEDGGQRQHIQVQLPEPTDAKSDAHKAGYSTIAEIGKERIRRAGKKIVGELKAAIKALEAKAVRTEEEEQELKEKKERLAKLDIGFRVFKLDSSNIAAWDGDPERMQENLLSAAENIKPDRTEADVLYEVLLKYGLDLTLPIEERTIATCTVYNVGMGALFLCLAERITNAVAEGIGQWKEELKPETCRVIFRDNGFTDVEKTNAVQTLKRYGVTEVRSV